MMKAEGRVSITAWRQQRLEDPEVCRAMERWERIYSTVQYCTGVHISFTDFYVLTDD